MPKINIYLPDDLAEAVKDAGVPVSAICQRALEQAVRRVTAIREVTAGAPYDSSAAGPSAILFTKRTMTILESAQSRASADSASQVGTGHLLTALVSGQNMAVHVLSALEITPRQVTAELDRRTATGSEPSPRKETGTGQAAANGSTTADPAELGLNAQLARAVELAANESSGLGNNYVGSEHLLLGLIGEPDGVAGSVLRSLGADLRVTRRTVAAALAGWGAGLAAHEERTAGLANQPPGGQAAAPGAVAEQLLAAIRAELAPVLTRIERLEGRTT